MTSFYEALNITAQLECAKKGMDFFPLWFLFAIVAMNILLVIEDFEVLGKTKCLPLLGSDLESNNVQKLFSIQ